VLCIAPSGIAALLLKGGHTAHSCFRISIPYHESSIYSIVKNSKQADLIHMTDLVIWNEAPMQHMSPPVPDSSWTDWSYAWGGEMRLKRALEKLNLKYPQDSAD
jgi:hypothetical protein